MKHSSLVVMVVVMVRPVWRGHVNLLVHQFQLLGFSLGNIQSDTEVVVVLDELFDCASSVSQVVRQHFAFTS